jgi:hypothetical protein
MFVSVQHYSNNEWTYGARHVRSDTEIDLYHKHIPTRNIRNNVCKSEVTASKRSFNVISGKYNVGNESKISAERGSYTIGKRQD